MTKQERKIAVIREENKIHLLKFEEWFIDKGFSKKTIDNHVSNVDFYINHCLVYDEPKDVTSGCDKGNINYFFGYWFNKKSSWASGSHIKSNAASFKKFYAFLLEKCVIKQSDYDELCETIKLDMSEWLGIIEETENQEFTKQG
jgi:hypothetical protein